MQRASLLIGENKKPDSQVIGIEIGGQSVNVEPQGPSPKEDRGQVLSYRFEFFTGFARCQALVFKSWIEATDKLIKLQSEKGGDKEIPSLYVDVHEEVFTNLFKSQSYASNLGRMINASMMMLKNWQNLTRNSPSEGNAGIRVR